MLGESRKQTDLPKRIARPFDPVAGDCRYSHGVSSQRRKAPPIEPDPFLETSTGLIADDLILDTPSSIQRDKFAYDPIANQVARLALACELPSAIALFAPWGAGKSSLFHMVGEKIANSGTPANSEVAVVTYDAWKFRGVSLKRNFLTHLCSQLGVNPDLYLARLYEDTTTTRVPLLEAARKWKTNLVRVALGAAGILVVIPLLAILFSQGSRALNVQPKWSELDNLWQAVASMRGLSVGLAASFAASLGVRLIDISRVQVRRAPLADDEEFEPVFHAIIDDATKGARRFGFVGRLKSPKNRVVILVDELDRCAPDDVVETLVGIRTFFHHPKCVFVVAADRDVIAAAFNFTPHGDDLRQVTPLRPDEPYYSSAGEFIDKLFQFKFDLPPQRRANLSRFALDLAASAGGIWANLREAGVLEQVIFVLVPLHVQSPRRVIGLLNSFATATRVLESRMVDWRQFPEEVAKYTTLRTEFPGFVRHLIEEPLLVECLQGGGPAEADRSQRLVALCAWYLNSQPATVADDAEPVADETPMNDDPIPNPGQTGSQPGIQEVDTGPGELINSLPDPVGEREAIRTQNRRLLNYLEKTSTAGVEGPRQSLLYMEPAGARDGLTQSESDAIDLASERAPARTVAAFGTGSAPVAIQLLAAELPNQVGQGRLNVAQSICQLAEKLDKPDIPAASAAAGAQIAQCMASGSRTTHMIPGLILLDAVGAGGDAEIAREYLLDVIGAFEPGESLDLAPVAALLPQLPDSAFAGVLGDLIVAYRKGNLAVLEAFASLPPKRVEYLWSNFQDEVCAPLSEWFDERQASDADSEKAAPETPDAELIIDTIAATLTSRGDVNHVLAQFLANVAASRREFEPTSHRLSADLPADPNRTPEYTELGVAGLVFADHVRWLSWAKFIGDSPTALHRVRAAMLNVLSQCVGDTGLVEQAEPVLAKLVKCSPDPIGTEDIYQKLGEIIDSAPPWESGRSGVRIRSFVDWTSSALLVTAETPPELTERRISDILQLVGAEMSTAGANELAAYISDSEWDWSLQLDDRLSANFQSTYPIAIALRVHSIVRRLRRLSDPEVEPIGHPNLPGLENEWIWNEAVRAWLEQSPDVADVVEASTHVPWLLAGNVSGAYTDAASREDRTRIWTLAVEKNRTAEDLRRIARGGVDVSTTERFFTQAANEARHEDRARAVDILGTLPFAQMDLGKQVFQLITSLLTVSTQPNARHKGVKQVDANLAARVQIAAGSPRRPFVGKTKGLFEANSKMVDKRYRKQLVGMEVLPPTRRWL